MKQHNLDRISILVADNDVQIARIIVASLQEMGFRRITHVRDSAAALACIAKQQADILITEWVILPMDGISLVQHLRFDKDSPNRGIPIIMLTGKGEFADVTAARDSGITEFLVKPFTVQGLYDRIVHLVDHPRSFVLTEKFVGPDRRRRPVVEDDAKERRKIRPKTIKKPAKELPPPKQTPVIAMPDHEIKRIIGLSEPLSSIITPAMIAAAENFLTKTQDDNLHSVKNDLAELEKAFADVQSSLTDTDAIEVMKNLSLQIKARSGTFGFVVPSRIARALYLFLNSDYKSTEKNHNEVVQRCIESIQVIFANDPKRRTGISNQLVEELDQLIARVTNA